MIRWLILGLLRRDDFLIDRVCQLVVNRLAPIVDTYRLAEFLITSAVFMYLAAALQASLESDYVAAALFAISALLLTPQIGWVKRAPRPRRGPYRSIACYFRSCAARCPASHFHWCCLSPPGFGSPRSAPFLSLGILPATLHFYVLACRNPPPPRKTSLKSPVWFAPEPELC
jgi:hypothetical protein